MDSQLVRIPISFLIRSIPICFEHTTVCIGTVMISPPGTAPVCDGDQLELTCSITGSQVEWSVFGIPENQTTVVRYGRRLLNVQSGQIQPLIVNSVLFNFSRISPPDSQPLITTVLTRPVHNDVNGTEVVCQDRVTRNSSSTIVNVINEHLIPGTRV